MAEYMQYRDLTEEEMDSFYEGLGDVIPSGSCEKDFLYLVRSRSIGDLAICRGYDLGNRMQFSGWRSKLGRDFMFTEYHQNDDETFGTIRPLKKLEPVPEQDDDDTLNWLLVRYIDLQQAKLKWLEDAPLVSSQTEAYTDRIKYEEEILMGYLAVKEFGFNHQPSPTFQDIANKVKNIAS